MINPSDCEAVQIAAMALADGETPLLTEQQVREHTQGCAACRDEAVRAQRSLLPVGARRAEHVADLWPAIEDRLVNRVPETQATSGLRRDARLWLALAAALLLLIGGPAWLYLTRQRERDPVVAEHPQATPSPEDAAAEVYHIPYDPPAKVTEAEFREQFAAYFGDEFQKQQFQRLGVDVDVERLRPVTIQLGLEHLGTLFLDQQGTVVLAFPDRWVSEFKEGFARIGTLEYEERVCRPTHEGYLDRTGKLHAIVAPYHEAEHFSEGLAAALKDGKYGYINRQGETVIEPQYHLAEPFQDGIARVWLVPGSSQAVQFIDRRGKVLLDSNVWDAGKFSEGLLYVNLPGRKGFDSGRARGYVDRNFEFVFRLGEDSSGFWPLRCEEFHDGMAAVEVGGSNQWSFINREGELAAPGPWFQVQPFSEGRAVVCPRPASGGEPLRWGYIDRQGEYILQPQYFGATSYQEGLAAVLLPLPGEERDRQEGDGAAKLPQVKWGYLDVAGRTRIPPRFYRAEPFENGLARVSENPLHFGFIDKTGKYVWQITQPADGNSGSPESN